MPSSVARVYREIRYGRAVIVVSGLPRSGTSMAMQMLEAAGVEILSDGVRKADESNPPGYYELERVKELEGAGDSGWLKQARGKAIKIISYLLPQLPQTLNYKIIFMQRDLHEVIASQNKMLLQRGEPDDVDDDRMRGLFVQHLAKTKRLIADRSCFDALDIIYRDVVEDPLKQAGRISAFLGGGLDVGRMAAVVDGRLYRNRR